VASLTSLRVATKREASWSLGLADLRSILIFARSQGVGPWIISIRDCTARALCVGFLRILSAGITNLHTFGFIPAVFFHRGVWPGAVARFGSSFICGSARRAFWQWLAASDSRASSGSHQRQTGFMRSCSIPQRIGPARMSWERMTDVPASSSRCRRVHSFEQLERKRGATTVQPQHPREDDHRITFCAGDTMKLSLAVFALLPRSSELLCLVLQSHDARPVEMGCGSILLCSLLIVP